jgi:hypothetical protein
VPASETSLKLLRRYHDQVTSIASQTAVTVERVISRVEPGADFQSALDTAENLIHAAQSAAASLAGGFFNSYALLETGEPPGEIDPLDENAGASIDGRALADVLGATRAKILGALREGRTFEEAIALGRASASRVAQTEVMDAARLELDHHMKEHPGVSRWRWLAHGTCPVCLGLDGSRERSPGESLNGHPGCKCIQQPVFDGAEDVVPRPTGRDRFDALSMHEQDNLLGSDRAELIRTGELDWDDLIQESTSEEWRDIVSQRPVEELKRLANLDTEAPNIIDLQESIVKKAVAEEPAVSARIRGVVDSLDGASLEGFEHRLKVNLATHTPERIASASQRIRTKIVGDIRERLLTPAQAAAKMNDALRFTVQIDRANYTEGLTSLLRELDGTFDRVSIKNFWTGNYGTDYRGVHLIFRTKTGQAFEVQVHTAETWAMKQGRSHELKEILDNADLPYGERTAARDELSRMWREITDNPPAGAENIR